MFVLFDHQSLTFSSTDISAFSVPCVVFLEKGPALCKHFVHRSCISGALFQCVSCGLFSFQVPLCTVSLILQRRSKHVKAPMNNSEQTEAPRHCFQSPVRPVPRFSSPDPILRSPTVPGTPFKLSKLCDAYVRKRRLTIVRKTATQSPDLPSVVE